MLQLSKKVINKFGVNHRFVNCSQLLPTNVFLLPTNSLKWAIKGHWWAQKNYSALKGRFIKAQGSALGTGNLRPFQSARTSPPGAI
ncbi:MAG: hypothetical protein DRR19_09390 [Candidatus Parabeggiatoa sp. nov. 1]|nr:MAG: hypothetical protein DRR19_09390 [Gammaproteobacteria bacterium]